MRALIATEYLTLDGVMEAPGESNPSARVGRTTLVNRGGEKVL
jgi:hypothetical protein